jgi:hypothetical protein
MHFQRPAARVILTDQRCEDVIREYRSVILTVYRIKDIKRIEENHY